MPYEDSDRTSMVHKLICVFAGRTCDLVGNAVSWLLCDADDPNTSQVYMIQTVLEKWWLRLKTVMHSIEGVVIVMI